MRCWTGNPFPVLMRVFQMSGTSINNNSQLESRGCPSQEECYGRQPSSRSATSTPMMSNHGDPYQGFATSPECPTWTLPLERPIPPRGLQLVLNHCSHHCGRQFLTSRAISVELFDSLPLASHCSTGPPKIITPPGSIILGNSEVR